MSGRLSNVVELLSVSLVVVVAVLIAMDCVSHRRVQSSPLARFANGAAPAPPARKVSLAKTVTTIAGVAAVLLMAQNASALERENANRGRYLKGFADAETHVTTFATATDLMPALTFDEAYALQHEIVKARVAKGDRIVGYKGGLMSAKSLADRHVTEPLTGVLFASGDTSAHETELCGYRRAAFEMKLGYVFKAKLGQKVSDIDALKRAVASVQPVLEVPDIAYRDDKNYSALDMVAANISSAKFVRGPANAKDKVDLDALRVSIKRDGAPVTQGVGKESLGGQWASLLTEVNLIIAHGYKIEPGQVIISGKIGDKGDLTPGTYDVDYGPMGRINIKVSDCSRRK
jgi:2-keto-4-pentenoate hydratase